MYVPDNAKVRSKMIYAASSSTLQRQLGGAGFFSGNVFWTELGEVSAKGWKAHLDHEKLSAPLTVEELSLKDVREKEASQMLGTSAFRSHVHNAGGSQFHVQLADDAKSALESLANSTGVVGLCMALPDETLILSQSHLGAVSVDQLASKYIDASNPQFTVYKPTSGAPATFVYTCPSGSKVKERMVYAVNRKAASIVARDSGVEIDKEIEGTSADDVLDELREIVAGGHVGQEKLVSKPRFNRPKAPGRR